MHVTLAGILIALMGPHDRERNDGGKLVGVTFILFNRVKRDDITLMVQLVGQLNATQDKTGMFRMHYWNAYDALCHAIRTSIPPRVETGIARCIWDSLDLF